MPSGFVRSHDGPARGAIWIEPPFINVIVVERSGNVTWNGVPISSRHGPWPVLDTYLGAVADMSPRPLTALDFDAGAPCKTIERVRSVMQERLECRGVGTCLQGPAPW